MNKHVAPPVDFFNGVILETDGIAERAAAIRGKTSALAETVASAAQARSVAILKAAINLNDTIGREIQQDVDRMRSLIDHLDRKLAAHQGRNARA